MWLRNKHENQQEKTPQKTQKDHNTTLKSIRYDCNVENKITRKMDTYGNHLLVSEVSIVWISDADNAFS